MKKDLKSQKSSVRAIPKFVQLLWIHIKMILYMYADSGHRYD